MFWDSHWEVIESRMNVQDAYATAYIKVCWSPQACLFMSGGFPRKNCETRLCFGKLCLRQTNPTLQTWDSPRENLSSSPGKDHPQLSYKNLAIYKPKIKDYFKAYYTPPPAFTHLFSAWLCSAQENIAFNYRYKDSLKRPSGLGWKISQKADLHHLGSLILPISRSHTNF